MGVFKFFKWGDNIVIWNPFFFVKSDFIWQKGPNPIFTMLIYGKTVIT